MVGVRTGMVGVRTVLAALFAMLSLSSPAFAAVTANSAITGQWPNRGAVSFLPATSTASTMAACTAISVTGSIAGNVLTVTAVSTGTLVAGAQLSNAGGTIPLGEEILPGGLNNGQISGTLGGVGTYLLSIGNVTVASGTITGTCGVVTIGGTVTGTYQVGDVLTGTSVPAQTYITQPGTGTGTAGTYYTNTSATIGSEAINADQVSTYKTLYTVGWGAPSGVNGSVCKALWVDNNDASATHVMTVQLVSAGAKLGGATIATVSPTTAGLFLEQNIMSSGASGNWPGLAFDQNGNPYFNLNPGDQIQVAYATALTATDQVDVHSTCGDF